MFFYSPLNSQKLRVSNRRRAAVFQAQAVSEIAFHNSPVFLNSKERLRNGVSFDQLNF